MLKNFYPDCDEKLWIPETIYRIINDIDVRPNCKTCGKPLKFVYGFKTFCSQRCSNADPEVLIKNKLGVSNSLKKAYTERGDEIKAKRSKSLGLDSSCGSPFALSSNQNKAKITMIERYGVDNAYKMDKCKNKAKIIQRMQSVNYQKLLGWGIEWVDILNSNEIIVHNCCEIHKNVKMTYSFFNNRTSGLHKRNCVLCPICNKEGHTNLTGMELHIKKYLEELGVKYILHDRKTIKPKEIDIYLPDYNIGIECNGIYWHSKEYNDSKPGRKIKNFTNVHLDKRLICESKGIKLIYFWEDRFITNLEAIKGHLGRLIQPMLIDLNTNFEIVNITKSTALDFNNVNNIFEFKEEKYYVGLYVKNNLYATYSFDILNNEIIIANITYKNGYKINNEILVFRQLAKLYDNIKAILIKIDQDLYNFEYLMNEGFDIISKDIPKIFCLINKDKNKLCRYEIEDLQKENINKKRLTCFNSGIAILKLNLTN